MFEFIKVAGEQVVATVSGYLNKDHLLAILGNAVTVAAEEIGNAAVRAAIGLTGTYDFAAKQIIRLLAGLGAWMGYKKLGADELAFAVGTTLPALVAIDIIKYLLKRESLEGFGKEVAERLGLARRLALASAGSPFRVTVVAAPVKEREHVTASEAGEALPI